MKLQYTDANGDTQYSTIAESTAIMGEWVQLANSNFKIPANVTNMYLYVETADSTNSFYLDETIGAVEEQGFLVQAHRKSFSEISIPTELSTLSTLYLQDNGCIDGFDSTVAQIAADVNQSGIVDETDLALI